MGEEIVGMIRGCIKTVTCGKKHSRSGGKHDKHVPIYTKVAYILGLRVSPNHRYNRYHRSSNNNKEIKIMPMI